MKLGKKLLKKAFTLVELVVVVAVIAILSAISVAAYVGITDRTKTEADRANVSEWNTLLKVETVEGTLNNVIEVKDYFKDQGFGDEDFIPRTNGYGYYYCLDNNTMYLVDDSDTGTFDVTYPEDTIGEVNEGNSYRLNNTYCALNSSIDGVTFSRNALIVGQDNEVGVIADTMPANIIINGADYNVSNGKIIINPSTTGALIAGNSSSKINATVTNPTAKTNLSYTGSSLELVNAGTTNGGNWYYKLESGEYSTNVPTATNAGTYTVYYKLVGNSNYYDIDEKTLTATINKATQSISAPTAESSNVTGTTVQLTEIASGHGTTTYGCSQTNDSSTVTDWQEYKGFYDLTEETTYYFFAKYAGDDNYEEAISQGRQITTTEAVYYSITVILNNYDASNTITADNSNPSSVKEGGSAELNFTVGKGYDFGATTTTGDCFSMGSGSSGSEGASLSIDLFNVYGDITVTISMKKFKSYEAWA